MNQPRGRLPIEPLPSSAWKRIHAEVFAELAARPGVAGGGAGEKSKWRHLAGAAVAAFVAVALVVGFQLTEQNVPRETASRIVTAISGTQATVGDAMLEAAPESELVATGSELAGWTVVLERGRVLFAVPSRANRPAFRVQAGSVMVEVVGTRFTVERAGNDVSVTVDHGVVRVTSHGKTQLISDGGRWATEPHAPAPMKVAPTQPGAQAPESIVQAPRPHTAAQKQPAETSREPSRRESYEAASRLEATEPVRALAGYLELSRGNDTWAANALYAAGRLELERGRIASARNRLEQYRARFPSGPNIHEARVLLERTQ